MYKQGLYLLFFLFLSCIQSFAQVQDSTYYTPTKLNYLEISGSFVQLSSGFKQFYNKHQFGFNFGYLRQLKAEKPLFWGIDLSYASLDNHTEYIVEPVEFSVAEFTYCTSSYFYSLHGKLRYYPNFTIGKVEAYFEGLLGTKWLLTSTSKSQVDNEDVSDFFIDKGALSLSYGAAFGISYPVSANVYLNAKINYLPGSVTPYYYKSEYNSNPTTHLDNYTVKRSNTDIVKFDLGVTFWPNFD